MVIFGSFQNGWNVRSFFSLLPPVLAVWGLVITGVYLLRAVKDVWYGDMPERWSGLRDARGIVEKAPFLILIGVLLFFGFHPQPMLDVIHQGTVPVVQRIRPDAGPQAAAPVTPQDAPADHDGHDGDGHDSPDGHGGPDGPGEER
jgi:NADH:ubiquinone oxidoreductase subunit 4 (subunit M)